MEGPSPEFTNVIPWSYRSLHSPEISSFVGSRLSIVPRLGGLTVDVPDLRRSLVHSPLRLGWGQLGGLLLGHRTDCGTKDETL